MEKYNTIKENFTNYTYIYTDGSKDGNRVGCAAIFKDTHLKQRLPDNASIFTAELKAIDLALDAVSESEDREFIIFSDSLSVLVSLQNKKLDNPLIINVLHSLHTLSRAHKTIVFCWIPSHIGIHGNEKADMQQRKLYL